MEMEYRRLGASGLKVSVLSFGSWVTFGTQLDTGLARDCLAAAWEAGVNFFDNAEAYGGGESERIMGRAIAELGWQRETYVVSTKVFWGLTPGVNTTNTLNRKYLLHAIDGSLERFGLDFVDLLFCHRPDPNTPIEETVWAMSDIVSAGKAHYWGTSEWSADEIRAAWEIADRHHLHKPVMEQPQYNMLVRDRFDQFRKVGVAPTVDPVRPDRSLRKGQCLVGNDQVRVQFHLRAEAGARGASAVGGVEGKGSRLDLAERDIVDGAGKMLRENQVLGFPFSVGSGQAWATDWNYSGLATMVARPKTGAFVQPDGTVSVFADPAAAHASFDYTYTGQSGTRNALRGPGYASLDMSLTKRWKLPWEGHTLQFRGELFNVPNLHRFNAQSFSSAYTLQQLPQSFGDFTSLLTQPRVMQFALRYEF